MTEKSELTQLKDNELEDNQLKNELKDNELEDNQLKNVLKDNELEDNQLKNVLKDNELENNELKNELKDNELKDRKVLKNDSGLRNMAKSILDNPQMRHYSLYLVFGVITTLVNLVIFKLLIDRGIHYTISTTIAFVVAVTVAFWTNRTWVFRSQSQGMKAIFQEMTSFFSVRILTYFVDIIGLVIFIELVHIDEFISKIIINVVVVVLNYLLSRFVVFQARV